MDPSETSYRGSALLAFNGRNIRSFRDEFHLSLLATALSEPEARRSVAWREGGKPIDVLPAAGLFGANASGKSNVLRALADMRTLVLHSFRHGSPTGKLPQKPFRLDPESADAPSTFEVDMVLEGVRHRYGFVVDRDHVIEEWAIRFPKGRAVLLFSRDGDHVDVGTVERSRTKAVVGLLRPNALFLSTAASANHPILLPLYSWFERNLVLAEAESRSVRQALTTTMLDDPRHRGRVLEFLRIADLGITGAVKRELSPKVRDRLERAMRILMGEEEAEKPSEEARLRFDETYGMQLLHRGQHEDVEFATTDESLGTLVWLGLVGPVLKSLADGSVLLADELDASLHPVLVANLVALFQDPISNPRRAQLIFNSHDTTILGESAASRAGGDNERRLLGRDQIWFTEKTDDGASRLYPLTDLDPRKGEAVERRYLAGRYGATPIVSRPRMRALAAMTTTNGVDEES